MKKRSLRHRLIFRGGIGIALTPLVYWLLIHCGSMEAPQSLFVYDQQAWQECMLRYRIQPMLRHKKNVMLYDWSNKHWYRSGRTVVRHINETSTPSPLPGNSFPYDWYCHSDPGDRNYQEIREGIILIVALNLLGGVIYALNAI